MEIVLVVLAIHLSVSLFLSVPLRCRCPSQWVGSGITSKIINFVKSTHVNLGAISGGVARLSVSSLGAGPDTGNSQPSMLSPRSAHLHHLRHTNNHLGPHRTAVIHPYCHIQLIQHMIQSPIFHLCCPSGLPLGMFQTRRDDQPLDFHKTGKLEKGLVARPNPRDSAHFGLFLGILG